MVRGTIGLVVCMVIVANAINAIATTAPTVSPTSPCLCDTSTWTNIKEARGSDWRYRPLYCGGCTALADLGGDGGLDNGLHTCRQWCASQQPESGGLQCVAAWEDKDNTCQALPSMREAWNWKCTYGNCDVGGRRASMNYSVNWGCDFNFSRAAGDRPSRFQNGDAFDHDFNGGDAICECASPTVAAHSSCVDTIIRPQPCPTVDNANTTGNIECNGYGRTSVSYCNDGFYKSRGTGSGGSDECVQCAAPCNSTAYAVTTCNDPDMRRDEWTVDTTCAACTEQLDCDVHGDHCVFTRYSNQDSPQFFRSCDIPDADHYVDRVVNLSLPCPERLGCSGCHSIRNSSVSCGSDGCFEIPKCTSCQTGLQPFPTQTTWTSYTTSWSYMCRTLVNESCSVWNVSTAEHLADAVVTAPTDGATRVIYIAEDLYLGALCYNDTSICNAITVPPNASIELIGHGTQKVLDVEGGKYARRRGLFVEDARIIVRNVAIINGYVDVPDFLGTGGAGGAVMLSKRTVAEFHNSRFEANNALFHGGAVGMLGWAYHGPPSATQSDSFVRASFTNCHFEDNNSTYEGGAAGIFGAYVTFENCTFVSNAATGDSGRGGAIFVSSSYISGLSRVAISGCNFSNCHARHGGAIKLYRGPDNGGSFAVLAGNSFAFTNDQPDVDCSNSDADWFGNTELYMFDNTFLPNTVPGTCPSCCPSYGPCCGVFAPAPCTGRAPNSSDVTGRIVYRGNIFYDVSSVPHGFEVHNSSAAICRQGFFCVGGGQASPCSASEPLAGPGAVSSFECTSNILPTLPPDLPRCGNQSITSTSTTLSPTPAPTDISSVSPTAFPSEMPSTRPSQSLPSVGPSSTSLPTTEPRITSNPTVSPFISTTSDPIVSISTMSPTSSPMSGAHSTLVPTAITHSTRSPSIAATTTFAPSDTPTNSMTINVFQQQSDDGGVSDSTLLVIIVVGSVLLITIFVAAAIIVRRRQRAAKGPLPGLTYNESYMNTVNNSWRNESDL